MPLAAFHPLVARWFSDTLGTPTDAQRRGWAAIRSGRHTLIAAPTGSGKTLAAFLTALDDLFQEGLRSPLPDEVRVVYVSPLKALSADIHKNLVEPRQAIRSLAEAAGLQGPAITAAVRTGDTTTAERAAMLRKPPHILVTTPESLYLLLTAEKSREMLVTARTVIVDEIHAVIGTRRGSHLAVTLERLQEIARAPLVRIGLSATQKPIEEVARFLVGLHAATPASEATVRSDPAASCAVIDEGHRRDMDLAVDVPRSPLEAVMSREVWAEYYDRLAALIAEHRTTIVFVNTRRLAERLARHLSERLGEDAVTAHHGSLSKATRLEAESRLKAGLLKALVATASLELGIDIGHVDLVCQIGSPHRIATLLQRVGRSGHTIAGKPKGRVFPTSRDDLMECAALLRSIRRGELDRVLSYDAPLDVLAQQIVAEASCADYTEDALFALVRRAWPYRDLPRGDFDAVLKMTADGFATKRGRRAALVHRDEVNGRVRGRRSARSLAITSGGAIPEVADYRVVLEPEETFIGTVNEDFAIESMAGDIFQLGNASWQVQQVVAGVVRVSDAKGAPPTIPFWFGEAPARSDELSRAVSDLRRVLEAALKGWAIGAAAAPSHGRATGSATPPPAAGGATDAALAAQAVKVASTDAARTSAVEWLVAETGIPDGAAEQIVAYADDTLCALGALPTDDTLILERFFDESGGMQLVLHAPLGSRVNRAWGLALRKRFCRQFNFELQAAATEDALLLSLGPQHSFPLSDVFRYLHPATLRDILVQALLDAPVFQTRWRWNATISLAVPRNRNGKKVPPQLQRMRADDLMAAVFPDAAACLENIPGDREIPDHPLVGQTIRDCLEEAMDLPALTELLGKIHRGELTLIARDTPEPSPFAHEILNARPYSFLDDAPLEERRTQAVYARRASEPSSARDLGALDADAIERVQAEARPDPRDADELHDALVTAGFLTADDARAIPGALFEELIATRRAGRTVRKTVCGVRLQPDASVAAPQPEGPSPPEGGHDRGVLVWLAAEHVPEWLAIHPDATLDPAVTPPSSRAGRSWTREEAIVELLRGRVSILGPTNARALASSMSVERGDVEAALLALESEGLILRGHFTPADTLASRSVDDRGSAPTAVGDELEWCDRRLLARIHRYTLNRLRAEIEPVSPADFMRFLFAWQHVDATARLNGLEGLRAAIAQLDGFELGASAWERAVLPARVDRYESSFLDMLCLTGEVAWARLSVPNGSATDVVGATPVALFLREHGELWAALRADDRSTGLSGPRSPAALKGPPSESTLGEEARRILDTLGARGALFLHEIATASALQEFAVRRALAELVAAGLVTSDGFAGLRAIIDTPINGRRHAAGRWSRTVSFAAALDAEAPGARLRDTAVETYAWTLLRRYGVVFRRVLTREATALAWRDLVRVYRRLEARGEIRGGRFVSGMSGEQFALPDAVERLREVRRTPSGGRLVTISAADPLNLTGIVTGTDRIRSSASSRIVYRDGVAVAALEGEFIRPLADVPATSSADITAALTSRRLPAIASGYVG